MRVIGITGGIASGKSTLLKLFRAAGVPGVDSDRIVHSLLRPGTRVVSEIRSAFGARIVTPDGGIDRRNLGRKIFADARSRRRLERIVHPAVFAEIDRAIRRHRRSGRRAVAVDVPLLYETHSEFRFDRIVVAYVPRPVQFRRLRARGLTALAARARVRAQWSLRRKAARADRVFDMTKKIGDLKGEIRQWLVQTLRATRASAKRSKKF